MPDKPEEVSYGSASSSKMPPFKLLPYAALLRIIRRFELGIERKGDKAWNALSKNQDCLTNLDFVIERCGHAAHHAMKLKAILAGEIPDDGDDHRFDAVDAAVSGSVRPFDLAVAADRAAAGRPRTELERLKHDFRNL